MTEEPESRSRHWIAVIRIDSVYTKVEKIQICMSSDFRKEFNSHFMFSQTLEYFKANETNQIENNCS